MSGEGNFATFVRTVDLQWMLVGAPMNKTGLGMAHAACINCYRAVLDNMAMTKDGGYLFVGGNVGDRIQVFNRLSANNMWMDVLQDLWDSPSPIVLAASATGQRLVVTSFYPQLYDNPTATMPIYSYFLPSIQVYATASPTPEPPTMAFPTQSLMLQPTIPGR